MVDDGGVDDEFFSIFDWRENRKRDKKGSGVEGRP